MKAVLPFALAATLLANGQASATPQTELQHLLDGYRAAWDHADALALASNFDSDGELSTPYGATLHGRGEIAQFYAAAFARGYKGSDGVAEVKEITAISNDALFARGRWGIHGARDETGAPRPPECGDAFAALRRVDGNWRIVALHELGGACKTP